MSLTYGSLFAGAGGFDLGFTRAGMRGLWACEIDKNCQKLLRARFPDAQLHDDITTFDPARHECPDAICFGSPCQDLSVAGLRAGIHDGDRSNLFFVAAGIIREYARRGLEFAVWEQVPGVFSSDAGRDFACVLRAMAQCGAVDVAWSVLDAQYRNVAQRRERVFLVADFRGERAAEILSLADGMSRDYPPSRKTGKGIARPIGAGSPGSSGYRNDADSADNLIPEISATLRSGSDSPAAHGKKNGTDVETLIPEVVGSLTDGAHNGGGSTVRTPTPDESFLPDVAWALQERDAKGSDSSTKEGHLIPTRRGGFFDGVTPTLSSSGAGTARTGNARTEAGMLIPVVADPISANEQSTWSHAGNNAGKTHNLIAFDTTQLSSKDNRCNPQPGDPCHPLASQAHPPAIAFSAKDSGGDACEDLSPTLRAGPHDKSHANGGVMPAIAGEYGVRRLTPLECLRLMGWPDDWFDGLGFADSTKYKMCGNGCVSNVTEWIGRRIVRFAHHNLP